MARPHPATRAAFESAGRSLGMFEIGLAEHALFTVLAGRCRVHRDDGAFQEADPGEALFVPGGFRGSLGALEAVTKTDAIVAALCGPAGI